MRIVGGGSGIIVGWFGSLGSDIRCNQKARPESLTSSLSTPHGAQSSKALSFFQPCQIETSSSRSSIRDVQRDTFLPFCLRGIIKGSPQYESEKVVKISEQSGLNGLQMVQFECPRHLIPSVLSILGKGKFSQLP